MWTHRVSKSLMLEKTSKTESNLWPISPLLPRPEHWMQRPVVPWRHYVPEQPVPNPSLQTTAPTFFRLHCLRMEMSPGSLCQNLSAITHPTPEIVCEVSSGKVCSCSGRQFITWKRNVTIYLPTAQIIHVSPPTFLCLFWNNKMLFSDKM